MRTGVVDNECAVELVVSGEDELLPLLDGDSSKSYHRTEADDAQV